MRENRRGSLSLFNTQHIEGIKDSLNMFERGEMFFDTLKQEPDSFEPGSCYLNRGILPVRRLIFFFSPQMAIPK